MMRPALLYIEKNYGHWELIRFMESTGLPLEYLEDENNWISNEYLMHFYERLVDFTGDPDAPFKAGLFAASKEAWGAMYYVFTVFGSPRQAFRKVADTVPDWTRTGTMEVLELRRNMAVIKWTNTLESPLVDANRRGQYCAIPMIWGSPQPQVTEVECMHRGDPACVYEIRWQNRASRIFGSLSLIGSVSLYTGLVAAGALAFDPLFLSVLVPGSFLIGRGFDNRRSLRQNMAMTQEIIDKLEDNVRQMRFQYQRLERANRELEVAHEKLRKHRDTLEETVAERTKELRKRKDELERALAELRETQVQMIHMAKMASLGTLAAGIAHEINNPINYVLGGIQPLKSMLEMAEQGEADAELWEDMKGLMEEVESGALRTARIVEDLRQFSHLDRGEFVPTDLNAAIDQTLRFLAKKLGDQIEVERDYGELGEFVCYGGQINQVLMNVLTNAADAILACEDGRKGRIRIKTERDEQGVRISITDNGKGIPSEILDQIFNPFFTTKAPQEGTGLGLSISHSIIANHGGRIEVESKEGEGTTFTITLPESDREEDSSLAHSGAAGTLQGGHS
jgi:signal transduction histidine kinase